MIKRKIAFVVQRYGKEINGGAELETRLYAERLADNYEVTVLTTCAIDHFTWINEYNPGKEILNEVKIIRFLNQTERKIEAFRLTEYKIFNHLHSFQEEEEWCMEQGPFCPDLIDYIEHHKEEFECFLFMSYLYYPTIVGLPMVASKSIFIPTAHDESQLYLKIIRQLFLAPRAIFFNTEAEKNLVHRVFKNQHIPYEIGGAGINFKEMPQTNENFRKKYNISGPFIIYVGRIEGAKGCEELIEFMDSYNYLRRIRQRPQVTLVLIGKAIMKIPQVNYIRHLGFVSEEDKYNGILESEFLVLPSQYESLSLVVLEAFSLGKAVVVNGNCQVLKDHCLQSRAGLYYTNLSEFTACADYLLEYPILCKNMGENGRKYQREHYTWGKIMNKLNKLIEMILNNT